MKLIVFSIHHKECTRKRKIFIHCIVGWLKWKIGRKKSSLLGNQFVIFYHEKQIQFQFNDAFFSHRRKVKNVQRKKRREIVRTAIQINENRQR